MADFGDLQTSEVARNYGLLVIAAIGVGLAVWRSLAAHRQAGAALQQAAVAQQSHAADIFNRAIDQLGSDKLEVRLGAIYTLIRIYGDLQYQDYKVPILETLQAYTRERSRTNLENEMPVDIREIISFLRRELRQ
ncbi:MAG TPA: hypothetical protein VMF53_07610 [Alphaproteobacteria bacterium]|nr:hypothetical protein [Alphaproteobacteria bacterium]